jgi:transcriptional regulator with XRE-family HTH domain
MTKVADDDLGARIREERAALGHTVTDAALYLEVSPRTQRAYEANESAPDARYLQRAAYRGWDVPYILNGYRGPAAWESSATQDSWAEHVIVEVLDAVAVHGLDLPPAKIARLVTLARRAEMALLPPWPSLRQELDELLALVKPG